MYPLLPSTLLAETNLGMPLPPNFLYSENGGGGMKWILAYTLMMASMVFSFFFLEPYLVEDLGVSEAWAELSIIYICIPPLVWLLRISLRPQDKSSTLRTVQIGYTGNYVSKRGFYKFSIGFLIVVSIWGFIQTLFGWNV